MNVIFALISYVSAHMREEVKVIIFEIYLRKSYERKSFIFHIYFILNSLKDGSPSAEDGFQEALG